MEIRRFLINEQSFCEMVETITNVRVSRFMDNFYKRKYSKESCTYINKLPTINYTSENSTTFERKG